MERAILIGINTGDRNFDYSLEELRELAKACEFEVVGVAIQNLDHPIAATYIGSGKIEEICAMEGALEADCCIFEETLSPMQLKNLQKKISARILDRTGLILEIFSKRAKTREAKLQVESAKLQYMMPRLIGMWEAIGRQGGGSGSTSNKGVGETQLELDKRWIQKRCTELRRELDAIEHDRDIQRRKRVKGNLPLVALVGYTNAGKSTLMNRLLGMSVSPANAESDEENSKLVFEKDMLFATLDTSVRKINTENKQDFLLSDTVGFLDKLPHDLIKAFRSTLDEVKYADLLLIVVDASDERHDTQLEVTMNTIKDLHAENIPKLIIMNKCDRFLEPSAYPKRIDDKIYMSISNNIGIELLISSIQAIIYDSSEQREYFIDYSDGATVSLLKDNANVIEMEYRENGVYIKAIVPDYIQGKCEKYNMHKVEKKKEFWEE